MSKVTVIAKPGMHDIHMTRDFDAPRELVFKAFTDPNLLVKWWGQKSSTTIVDKMEVKVGGIWRYVQHESNGEEYAFHGVYHAVVPSERIVYTFEFEGMPGHVLLETITFEDINGKTRLIDTSVFQTIEARDGMLQAGMEEGAHESYELLDELLATLK